MPVNIIEKETKMDKEFIKRNAKKLKAIMFLGKKCKICGENLCEQPWAAEFHHKDPSKKDYNLSNAWINKSWKTMRKELKKCSLLCSKCHQGEHFNKNKFNRFKQVIQKLAKGQMLEKLPRRQSTQEEQEEAKKLFLEGLSYKEIGRRLRFKAGTIRLWLPRNKKVDFCDIDNEKKIIELYERQKKGLTEICSIMKCTFRTLKRKVRAMVEEGKIDSIRKNISNKYIKNPIKISINGKIYLNVPEASRDIKVGLSTIYARLKRNAKGYKYITRPHLNGWK